MLSSEGQKGPKVCMVSLNKASYWKYSVFEIGPPAWIEEINTNTIEHHLVNTTVSLFYMSKIVAWNWINLLQLLDRIWTKSYSRIWISDAVLRLLVMSLHFQV
jgi:hypothetical protein